MNNLRWGKPERYRKYFIERPFNFNRTIKEFLEKSKSIKCINPACKRSFAIEHMQFLEFNKFICPDCQHPVKVTPISERIKEELERIDNSKLMHRIEYGILNELAISAEASLRAKAIAEELDCSYQLVGKKAKKLDEEKGLLERNEGAYSLTIKAKKDYFPVLLN